MGDRNRALLQSRTVSVLCVLAAVLFVSSGILGCAGRVARRGEYKVPKGRDASYYYLLAEMEMRRNRPAKALTYIEEAIDQEPRAPHLWYKKGFLEAALGDLRKAEEDVGRALQLDPADSDANILLGKICQAQDRLPEAVIAYRKALETDPASEEANVLLLETYIADKKTGSALRLVRRWQREEPDNVLPIFYEAWIYQNFAKNLPLAISAYRRVIELDPSNVKALSALAEIYVERKDDRRALQTFSQLEALAPDDVNLKLKTAIIYYEQKQYDKAVRKFQEVLRGHPDDDRIIYYMGVIHENLKQDDEARVEFEKIKPDSNFYKDARLHLSFLKVRARDFDGAIEVMEDAIRRRPDVGPFYEYLAEILRDRKNYEKAIDVLNRGLKKSEEKESLWYSLGMVYDKAGRFEDMVRCMREVLDLNPQNPSALNYLGYSYADRGVNLDEALELLQKAVALRPNDGFIMDSLGWVYFKRGEWDKAENYVRKAYELVPNESTIAEHLGDVYARKNDRVQALKYYREAEAALEKKTGEGEADLELERVRGKIGEWRR